MAKGNSSSIPSNTGGGAGKTMRDYNPSQAGSPPMGGGNSNPSLGAARNVKTDFKPQAGTPVSGKGGATNQFEPFPAGVRHNGGKVSPAVDMKPPQPTKAKSGGTAKMMTVAPRMPQRSSMNY